MGKKTLGVKIEKGSKIVLFWAVAVISILTALNYFFPATGVIKYVGPVLSLGIALFVLGEVKYFDGFRKMDIWRMVGSIVAFIVIIGVIIELIPQIPELTLITTFQGILVSVIALYFVVEGLR